MKIRRRIASVIAGVLCVTLAATTRPTQAQTVDLLEVSQTCVAIGEHVSTFTVWGTGFDQFLTSPGSSLTVEWSWAGAPSFPNPAQVLPLSRPVTSGTFTMTFDVTGLSDGLGGFNVISRNAAGIPGEVAFVNVDINPTCPTGSASCRATPGPGALLVSTAGFDPTWSVQFFYQYHLPDQAGPVSGVAAADGSVRGQFEPAPQTPNATVTAKVVQPAGNDSPEQTFFVTFDAPICHDVQASLSISPNPFDFATVTIGSQSTAATFNVLNTGTLAAPISGVTIAGGQAGEFVVEGNSCSGTTLAPGASCPVTVRFAPAGTGARAATLTVTSTNTATASANLSGAGVQVAGLAINPASKNFGSVAAHGSSPPAIFTVVNTGGQTETITAVTLAGSQAGEFAVDAGTCASALLKGGATCTVAVFFRPTGAGSPTATVLVRSNINASASATLSGTGEVGLIGFDPNPVDFGPVAVGTTSTPMTVKVTNTGMAPSTVSTTRVSGANAAEFFVVSDSCSGRTVAPGASCAVDVSFRPGGPGNRSATLDVDDSDGTAGDGLQGVAIVQAVLKFTPPVVSAGSLATVVGQGFPPNTPITLDWQESGIHAPVQVTSDAAGRFTASFIVIVGERLGPRHLEAAPETGVLVEPRPVAPLLVQASTFRPQGEAIRSGGLSPTLVSRR